MTRPEAVDWICQCDGCDRRSALRQLRDALGDRELHIKWEDQKLSDRKLYVKWEFQKAIVWDPEGVLLTNRLPASFWRPARIRGAKVFDPETKNWRTLLILKHDVLQLWKDRSDRGGEAAASAASESRAAGRDSESGSAEAAPKPVSAAALKAWYATRVREWRADKKPPSEALDVSDARAEFPDRFVSRDRVRALRASAAPDEWKRPGRKSRG
jgi:hypothetical protein